jgi:2-dehydropantoate 2-reductase
MKKTEHQKRETDMELNKENIKKIILIFFAAIAFSFALNNVNDVLKFLGILLSILAPFIFGLAIAFVLNVPLSFLERTLFSSVRHPILRRIKRPISILATYLTAIVLTSLIVATIVPQILSSARFLADQLPKASQNLIAWASQKRLLAGIAQELSETLATMNWQTFVNDVVDFLRRGAILESTWGTLTAVLSGFTNTFIAVVFSLYALGSKEKLERQVTKLAYTFLPEKICDRLVYISSVAFKSFRQFITGQFIEACILGGLCFIGMRILSIPLSLMVSSMILVSALIPMIGALVGTVLGTLFILIIDPQKALVFLIFLVLLQQFEGNLIYPRVVGSRVGLPPMWVLMSITVGGSLFGLVGMLLFVPLASTVYVLLREYSAYKLREEGISLSEKRKERERMKTRKSIQSVGIVGRGALGILYGVRFHHNLNVKNLVFIADEARVKRYATTPVTANGIPYTFQYRSKRNPVILDTILVAVKGNDLADAIDEMRPFVGPDTILVSVLNGISSEEALSVAFGEEHLLYAVAAGMDAVREGNALTFQNEGVLSFGEKDGAHTSKAEVFRELLETSGIPHEMRKDILRFQYSKLMLNTGINQVIAVHESDYGLVQKEGAPKEQMLAAMREVIAVANAEGVDLNEKDIAEWEPVIAALNPRGKPSMRQDLEQGRATEVELFAGTVRKLGRTHGIPTPVNDDLYDAIKAMEQTSNGERR